LSVLPSARASTLIQVASDTYKALTSNSGFIRRISIITSIYLN